MDPEVLSVLQLIRMCQVTGGLPSAGGVLDQDAYFMFLYMHVRIFDDERQDLDMRRAKMKR